MEEKKFKSAGDVVDEQMKNWERDQQRKMHEERRKASLASYGEKLNEIADLIELNIREHGDDYFVVEILTTYLDVALKLNDVMKTMSSVDTVVSCISDATSFIDQSMKFNDMIMDETLVERYGWFSNLRANMKARRVMRNNINRMKQVGMNIVNKYKMAISMVQALETASAGLKKMTKKIGDANAKRHAKGKSSEASAGINEAAKKFLEARRNGGAQANTGNVSPASGTAAEASGGSGLTDGI